MLLYLNGQDTLWRENKAPVMVLQLPRPQLGVTPQRAQALADGG